MQWNLVDHLKKTSARRAFYFPLGSLPPDKTTVLDADSGQWDFAEVTTAEGYKSFQINMTVASSATDFVDDGDLPDPVIRLHAMAPGRLSFAPASGNLLDRLILEMPMFLTPLELMVPWWSQWVAADCLPYQLIYENVDTTHFHDMLNAMDIFGAYGLAFPNGVIDDVTKAEFITGLMAGTEGYHLDAKAGAVIGRAGLDSAASHGPNSRLLTLHGRYYNHTDANQWPMHPKEFIYLLFGNDSKEVDATGPDAHPFAVKMEAVGLADETAMSIDATHSTGPETKSMRLRPPLRTYQRLVWEAELENSLHQAGWTSAASLQDDRFYNRHERQWNGVNLPFNYQGAYVGYKCNLYVSDISIRSGFHACIHPVGPGGGRPATVWHFHDAGMYTSRVSDAAVTAAGATDYIGVPGRGEDATRIWAYNIENWVWNTPAADRLATLNSAMTENGSCFVMAGRRAAGSGHHVFIKEFTAVPVLNARGTGVQELPIVTLEAGGTGGGYSRTTTFALAGPGGGADANTNFVELQIIELFPGRDPDTVFGQNELNVRNTY